MLTIDASLPLNRRSSRMDVSDRRDDPPVPHRRISRIPLVLVPPEEERPRCPRVVRADRTSYRNPTRRTATLPSRSSYASVPSLDLINTTRFLFFLFFISRELEIHENGFRSSRVEVTCHKGYFRFLLGDSSVRIWRPRESAEHFPFVLNGPSKL